MGLMDDLNKGALQFGISADKKVKQVKDALTSPETKKTVNDMISLPGKIATKVKDMVTGADVDKGLKKESK